MNFLALCQRVAQESGTLSTTGAAVPTSVVGQTNRLLKVVNWTAEAWRQIQTERRDWTWMQTEFTSANVSAGQQRYTGASFGLTTRFADWAISGRDDEDRFSLYRTATGVSDESVLAYLPFDTFYGTLMRGSGAATTGKPRYFTVSPQRELILSPIPEAAYTIRGFYRKSAQMLAANADTPECPEDHHMAIVWKALVLLGQHDEAVVQQPGWVALGKEAMGNLRRQCLPRFSEWAAEPLA